MSRKVSKAFYHQSALEVAPQLIGKLLCRRIENQIYRYRIIETEAYYSMEDTACHAHKGKTERTKVMFYEGGHSYIYLCYGIHSLFNIVTGSLNHPEAVLIRGVEGYIGPGKLTKALKIDRLLNGISLLNNDEIWIEDDGYIPSVLSTKRIGIDYATEEYRDKLWRFIDEKYFTQTGKGRCKQ